MDSIRKWFYKPRRDDTSLLAQFFYADESLNLVAAELDSFDGRKDPERCTSLVNRLRQCQDKVLNICNRIMDELIPDERADRGFRVKFPDDVMQDNLAGQLWFGAECLAAGSSIMNREVESGAMRPLAKFLTKSLENVRNLLREASLRTHAPTELAHDRLLESLKVFDEVLADFELCYVSVMVPVKSVHEYQLQQDVVVLFSETLHRALRLELLSQDQVEQCDPALMFTIPRLAIVTGLLIHPEGPLCLDTKPANMSEMFRPFRTLLVKIRELLWTLSEEELLSLEKMLCSSDDPNFVIRKPSMNSEANETDDAEGDASEENSVWAGDASECETVLERAPPVQTDFPTTPDDSEDVPELEEDRRSNGESSDVVPSANLNGQWTLPVIPCSCSDDGTMTRQGLMNRSLQDGECECARESEAAPGPSESGGDISCSENVNYVQNVGLGDAGDVLRTKGEGDRWTAPAAEDDLHVRYKENWDALCASGGPLPTDDDDDKRQPSEPAAETGSISTSCSSCQSTFSVTSDSCSMTSETSSFNSECQDEVEVALALQAVQLASRDDARAKFRSSADLLHRLFVCISGVADQLQTNFAGDLRHILKSVFLINSGDGDASDAAPDTPREESDTPPDLCEDALVWGGVVGGDGEGVVEGVAPPLWLPDEAAPACMSCQVVFTVIRRRHHCRNCGKVFCARCSSNSVPLPRFGHVKPVRVCNFCFIYQVTPFSVVESIPTD